MTSVRDVFYINICKIRQQSQNALLGFLMTHMNKQSGIHPFFLVLPHGGVSELTQDGVNEFW